MIEIFDFNGFPVRVTESDDMGWFSLSDVCAALTIENPSRVMAEMIPEDEKAVYTDPTGGDPRNGVPRQLGLISEAGLYRLIFRSRKPAAEKFTKWVVSEVLPSIRKTGRYALTGLQDAQEVRSTLLEVMRKTASGEMPVARAQAVSGLAKCWLSTMPADEMKALALSAASGGGGAEELPGLPEDGEPGREGDFLRLVGSFAASESLTFPELQERIRDLGLFDDCFAGTAQRVRALLGKALSGRWRGEIPGVDGATRKLTINGKGRHRRWHVQVKRGE